MFDVKSHKPKNKIRFQIYHCDNCQEALPYPREAEKCPSCGEEIKNVGSFWIQAEMIVRSELDKTIGELFEQKVLDWGELSESEKEFPCTTENKKAFYDNQPAIAEMIIIYLQQRNFFGMVAISEFKKKLNKRKNGSLNTQKRKKSLQTAEDV